MLEEDDTRIIADSRAPKAKAKRRRSLLLMRMISAILAEVILGYVYK